MGRKKLARFYTWDDYKISKERYHELKGICQSGKHKQIISYCANKAEPFLSEYIILSVTKNLSYYSLDTVQGISPVMCCTTDFYGYRRLFYHYLDKTLKRAKK
jgi:hypothetical protein